MSTLIKLQDQRMLYKKEGRAKLATLLSTVLGDFQNKITREKAGDQETEIQGVLRYFLKNIREFKLNLEKTELGKEDPRYLDLVEEESAIEALLPQQLSEDQLKAAMVELVKELSLGAKDKGKLMGALKQKHAGLYDGAMAAKLSDSVLQQ